jgi:predicted phage terminase large subunit-like protein
MGQSLHDIEELDPETLAVARRIAREDFYFFSRWMFLRRKGFKWLRGEHHKAICDALVRVYLGECLRLIINVAPRYSKTELAVINFISWTLGHVPDSEYIHTSYSGRLAANNSWQTRDLVQHEEYRAIFCDEKGEPTVHLKTDSQAKDEWRTQEGGCIYAVGAGGTITGYGAGKQRPGFGGAIVIDDPHKADEARSDVVRQGVIDGFQNTLESRLNSPQTPIILIMQRLHENDLAGWLLGGGNGEKWELLCLQTLQDEGGSRQSALWPAKHTVEDLLRLKLAKPYTFSGQYQQSPCAPEGNIFKPDFISTIDAIPAGTVFVRAWDLGATDGSGDYTVGFKLGRMPDGRYLIADIVREQYGPEDVEKSLKATASRDGRSTKVRLPQDPGQAGKAQIKNLTKLLAGYTVVAKTITGDKVVRAEPFAAQVNVGNVCQLNAPWNGVVNSEMKLFPNGAFDDIEDAGADAFNELVNTSFFSDCAMEEDAPEDGPRFADEYYGSYDVQRASA